MRNEMILRELVGIAELKDAERFQRLVWGDDDPADNSDMLLAIQHEGGLVAGAFDDKRLVGFLFGFPTSDPKAQHSHRLGVHPDMQGRGLGVRLKQFQRDWCLERGIETVRWTYDPIRRANAVLNIARLGATAGTYYRDYYGQMEGINAGVPSDRLLAEWNLKPSTTQTPSETGYVAIPKQFSALLATDLTQAKAERLRVRSEIEALFADGFRIVGFDPEACRYRFARS